VDVPTPWLEDNIAAGNIEEWPGYADQVEYNIPPELFGELNEFPRFPWDPWK
jgi:hypothetical protein